LSVAIDTRSQIEEFLWHTRFVKEIALFLGVLRPDITIASRLYQVVTCLYRGFTRLVGRH